MSDKSIPNFAIIGGGPMALLSAYYINSVLPTSSIVILDNRGSYTRGDGWKFTISVEVIKYFKKTFSYDKKFIKFLDDIKKILKNCNTFPINALEIALYNNLQGKIYIIKCNVSLDEKQSLSIFPTVYQKEFWINSKTGTHPENGTTIIKALKESITKYYNKDDNTEYIIADKKYTKGLIDFTEITIQGSCCEEQIDFLKKFKIDYIFNCTGGRLNTNIYWRSTLNETKEYLTELTKKCLQNAGIEEKHLSKLNVSLLPTPENPLWYVRSFETFDHLPRRGFQNFDKLSVLKPSTKIKIQLDDTLNECPLFNIGDSIMTVDYNKKIGLALGMSNIRIILDIIKNPQDNLEELYVEKIVTNFDTLSKKLLLFCTIPDYYKILRDKNKQKYKYFNLLTDKGKECNTDNIAPESTNTWSEDIIKCTLESNPDNLTEDELNKCLSPLLFSDSSQEVGRQWEAIIQYNYIQDELYNMNFNKLSDDKKKLNRELFDKLIILGMDLKKILKEKNEYHTIKKKVHLENNFSPYNHYKKGDRIVLGPPMQGGNKYGGKIQNKKTKNEKKTKNLKNKKTKRKQKKRTKKRQQKKDNKKIRQQKINNYFY